MEQGLANPSLFFKKLNERIRDYVICAGQRMHVLYANAYLKIRSPRSYLATTNHGAMDFGFPAGIAVSLLEKKSLAVVGNGEFMMTIQDLETAVRENARVKIVVVNDNSYRVLYFRQSSKKAEEYMEHSMVTQILQNSRKYLVRREQWWRKTAI